MPFEVERDVAWTKPVPAPDATSAEFWRGAARGELRIQRCPRCGHRQHYPRALCTACGAVPEFETARGTGRVHTFTVIRQYGMPPFAKELPYVVAMIELDEGVRLMANVTGCAVDDVHVGMRVEAYAVAIDDELAVPYFRPARDGDGTQASGGAAAPGAGR